MEKYGFFPSINGDRKYKTGFFFEFFSSIIGNGIYPNPATNLQVVANGDMTITLKKGKAWINGGYYNNPEDKVIKIDIADGVANRVDKVVIRFDSEERSILAKVKKGAYGSATPQNLVKSDVICELGIADISIDAGLVSITQDKITDLRLDNTQCGVVHAVIDQVDTTEIFRQFQDWFNAKKQEYDEEITTWTAVKKLQLQTSINALEEEYINDWSHWFNEVKDVLSDDAAGNLLNLIKINDSQISDINTRIDNLIKLDAVDPGANSILWLCDIGESNIGISGVNGIDIENAETSDIPPNNGLWFVPI